MTEALGRIEFRDPLLLLAALAALLLLAALLVLAAAPVRSPLRSPATPGATSSRNVTSGHRSPVSHLFRSSTRSIPRPRAPPVTSATLPSRRNESRTGV